MNTCTANKHTDTNTDTVQEYSIITTFYLKIINIPDTMFNYTVGGAGNMSRLSTVSNSVFRLNLSNFITTLCHPNLSEPPRERDFGWQIKFMVLSIQRLTLIWSIQQVIYCSVTSHILLSYKSYTAQLPPPLGKGGLPPFKGLPLFLGEMPP